MQPLPPVSSSESTLECDDESIRRGTSTSSAPSLRRRISLADHAALESVRRRSWLARKRQLWARVAKRSFTLPNVFPFLYQFEGYTALSFFRDFVTGLTITAVLVGQGLAYALAIGVDPAMGLLAVIYTALFYPWIGHMKTLVFTVEASPSVVVLSAINVIVATNGDVSRADIVVAVSFVAALMYFYLFVTRRGYICHLISGALLVGLLAAIAIVIKIATIPIMLGVKPMGVRGNVAERIEAMVEEAEQFNVPTAILSVVSLVYLFLAKVVRKLCRKKGKKSKILVALGDFPFQLVYILASIILSWQLDWAGTLGIKTVGVIDNAWYTPGLPWIPREYWGTVISTAMVLVVIGFTETTLTEKELAKETDCAPHPNRSAFLLSILNLVTSLGGAMPVTASESTTRICVAAAPGSMLGILIAGILTAALYGAAPVVFSFLPAASIAALIFSAAFEMLRFHKISKIFRQRDGDDILRFLLAFGITAFVDLEIGVLVSLVVSMIILARYSKSPRLHVLARDTRTGQFVKFAPASDKEPLELVPESLIIAVESNLFYFNSDKFAATCSRLERQVDSMLRNNKKGTPHFCAVEIPPETDGGPRGDFIQDDTHKDPDVAPPLIKNIVFDLSGCGGIDTQGAAELYAMVKQWTARDAPAKRVWFVHTQQHHREALYSARVLKNKRGKLGEVHVVASLAECVDMIEEARVGASDRGEEQDSAGFERVEEADDQSGERELDGVQE